MENRLKQVRKANGMTQDQLAQAVGATKRQVGAWERGENELPMDYADAIADLFGCSIDYLAGRVGYFVMEMPPDDDGRPIVETDDEEELLFLYRRLPKIGKHAVITGLHDYVELKQMNDRE